MQRINANKNVQILQQNKEAHAILSKMELVKKKWGYISYIEYGAEALKCTTGSHGLHEAKWEEMKVHILYSAVINMLQLFFLE